MFALRQNWHGDDISSFQTYVSTTEATRILVQSSGQPVGSTLPFGAGHVAIVQPIREGDDFDLLLEMPVFDAGVGMVQKQAIQLTSTWDFD